MVEECQVPANRNIRADQLIRLTGARAQADYPELLRRIVVWDAENQREIVLLTNLLEFGSTTIAAIYKERWQIELFFKVLKQNLTVKTFVGTSENAIRIQIWTALIALLLLKWLHHLSKTNWSLSNLAAMLRLNLFTYRDLTKWLHDPMETPPLVPDAEQLTLAPLYDLDRLRQLKLETSPEIRPQRRCKSPLFSALSYRSVPFWTAVSRSCIGFIAHQRAFNVL